MTLFLLKPADGSGHHQCLELPLTQQTQARRVEETPPIGIALFLVITGPTMEMRTMHRNRDVQRERPHAKSEREELRQDGEGRWQRQTRRSRAR